MLQGTLLADGGPVCCRVHFWLTEEGQLHVSVNHQQVTRLATGVAADRPLWALIDVYGNTQSVQITGDGEDKKFCPYRFGGDH